jgi:YVTN family beta-propeller protein
VAFDGSQIWVAANRIEKFRLDGTPAGSLPFGGGGGMLYSDSSIWVTTGNAIARIDPSSSAVTATIPVGSGALGIAAGSSSIWVASIDTQTVDRINPATNAVIASIPMPGEPYRLVFDGSNIWVTLQGAGSIARIDPATNSVTARLAVGAGPQGIAFDGSSIWVANTRSNSLSKISPN